jgi:hypothetical protein
MTDASIPPPHLGRDVAFRFRAPARQGRGLTRSVGAVASSTTRFVSLTGRSLLARRLMGGAVPIRSWNTSGLPVRPPSEWFMSGQWMPTADSGGGGVGGVGRGGVRAERRRPHITMSPQERLANAQRQALERTSGAVISASSHEVVPPRGLPFSSTRGRLSPAGRDTGPAAAPWRMLTQVAFVAPPAEVRATGPMVTPLERDGGRVVLPSGSTGFSSSSSSSSSPGSPRASRSVAPPGQPPGGGRPTLRKPPDAPSVRPSARSVGNGSRNSSAITHRTETDRVTEGSATRGSAPTPVPTPSKSVPGMLARVMATSPLSAGPLPSLARGPLPAGLVRRSMRRARSTASPAEARLAADPRLMAGPVIGPALRPAQVAWIQSQAPASGPVSTEPVTSTSTSASRKAGPLRRLLRHQETREVEAERLLSRMDRIPTSPAQRSQDVTASPSVLPVAAAMTPSRLARTLARRAVTDEASHPVPPVPAAERSIAPVAPDTRAKRGASAWSPTSSSAPLLGSSTSLPSLTPVHLARHLAARSAAATEPTPSAVSRRMVSRRMTSPRAMPLPATPGPATSSPDAALANLTRSEFTAPWRGEFRSRDLGVGSTAPERGFDVAAVAADPVVQLPGHMTPLARVIAGSRPVAMRTGPATRRALARAGKKAATVDNVIHLAEPPSRSMVSAEVVAHELVHAARPSAEPRFFDDHRHSVEEDLAHRTGQLIRSVRPPVSIATTAGAATSAMGTTIGATTLAATMGARGLPVAAGGASASMAQAVARATGTASLASGSGGPPPVPAVASSGDSTIRRSLAERTADLFRQPGGSAPDPHNPKPGDAPTIRRAPEDGPLSSSSSGSSSSSTPTPNLTPGPSTPTVSPADLKTELDKMVDRIVEALEQRVIDELERRGRRHHPGVF